MTALESPEVEMCDRPKPLSRSGRRVAEKFQDVLCKIDELLVATDAAAACTDEQLTAVFGTVDDVIGDERGDVVALRYNLSVARFYIDTIMPYLGDRPTTPPASPDVVPSVTFYWCAEDDETELAAHSSHVKRIRSTTSTPEAQQTAVKFLRVVEKTKELLALVKAANEYTDAQLAAAFGWDGGVYLARLDLGGLLFNLSTAEGRLGDALPNFESA